jgi:ribosomal protein S18 acetylase RimI-like enzyme
MTGARPAWDVLWQGCAAYSGAGATVVDDDRIRWFATGVGYEGLNGVFVGPGTPAVPVEDALRTFQRTRVPALWHIGVDGDQPPAAEPIAWQPGVSWYEEEPLMVAPVGRYELPGVAGLSVFAVHDRPGVAEWVRVWSGRQGGAVFDATVAARLGAGRAFTHLLAVLGGVPVGCAAVFTGPGSAGEVQHVVTTAGVRGRGVGTALTVAALRTMGARGCDTAVLTSSPDGLRLYQRLGFRAVGRIRRYLWSPDDVGNAAVITRPDGARNIAAPANDVGGRGGYPAHAWVQRPAMPS